jgi:transcriptional regulator with XRE-family HTH domain
MATRARKLDKSVHSEGQSAFSKLMIEARKSARLTQHGLAKRLHKPQSFVAKYEGGERRIDVVEFVTVCQAIGADPAKLLKALIKGSAGRPTKHRHQRVGNDKRSSNSAGPKDFPLPSEMTTILHTQQTASRIDHLMNAHH